MLYYKIEAKGDIFEEKDTSEQFFKNKDSNDDPTESNTINQSNTKSC